MQNISSLNTMRQPMPTMEVTPIKMMQTSSLDKDLGSTQLRKTVFKKHYADKSKLMGQPSLMKGNHDSKNPFTAERN